MTEKYILVSDEEYCYTLDTSDENYKTLEDFEKQELENAKNEGINIKDYEDAILESASDKYWDWVYNNHLDADVVHDIMNVLVDENTMLKKENKELKKENVNIISDLDYYRVKSGSCEEGLFQKDKEIAKLEKENKQLQQELFDSEYECICVNYHNNSVRRDDRIEELKEEFKERFGKEFKYENKRFRPKIRWKEQNTPIMKGHMHINVWIQNYTAKLPKIRKNMMFNIRRRFSFKCVELVI